MYCKLRRKRCSLFLCIASYHHVLGVVFLKGKKMKTNMVFPKLIFHNGRSKNEFEKVENELPFILGRKTKIYQLM